TAAITAPRNGAVRYTQIEVNSAAAIAGPSERAGFIDAPVTGPPNIASSPTVAPIAIAAASPTARVSVATAMITNIRKNDSTASHRKACPSDPLGSVAPRWATLPSDDRRTSAAAVAKGSCDAKQAATREVGKWRETANASVTAGLKCAPEMCPTA